jgi:hypothetical protein
MDTRLRNLEGDNGEVTVLETSIFTTLLTGILSNTDKAAKFRKDIGVTLRSKLNHLLKISVSRFPQSPPRSTTSPELTKDSCPLVLFIITKTFIVGRCHHPLLSRVRDSHGGVQ